MTITLRPGNTVLFTGDSITDLRRPVDEDRAGCGYPLRIAGEWCFRHPDRPVTWLNTANAGDKVMDLEARWQTDVLDAHPDVVSILVGVNDMGWHTLDPQGYVIGVEEFEAGYDRLLAPLAEFSSSRSSCRSTTSSKPVSRVLASERKRGRNGAPTWTRRSRPSANSPTSTTRACSPPTGCSPNSPPRPDRNTGLKTACTRRRPATPHSRRPGFAWSRDRASKSPATPAGRPFYTLIAVPSGGASAPAVRIAWCSGECGSRMGFVLLRWV
jgi:hypothetical protein